MLKSGFFSKSLLLCLKFFKNFGALVLLVQNKPSASREENKVDILEGQFRDERLSFVHKKETEYSFELSLSIWVFFRCILKLEMQNYGLENHRMVRARRSFCWKCLWPSL